MADFVFEWEKEKYPNIHGRIEDYEGGQILQVYDKSNNTFKNIELRYLNTMKQQLIQQQKSDVTQEYIKAKNIVQFKKLEAAIEEKIVTNYNDFVNNFETQYFDAASKISSGLKEGDKQRALKGVDDLINIFKQYDTSVNLIDTINGTKLNSSISVELAELLKIGNLIKRINEVISGETSFSEGPISSALTAPSEALAGMIDYLANGIADDKVFEMLEKSMIGESLEGATYTFGDKRRGITQNIKTKSADVQLTGRNISLSELITLNKENLDIDYVLNVDSYATAKAYRGEDAHMNKLTSYSGKNSILMNELRGLYSSNIGSDQFFDYQAYNTIAFSSEKDSVLQQNFKIMKSDMICELAEKFIVGFEGQLAQRIMIHNFKAYPILSIISAIATQATEKIEEGKTYDSNNIFGITISKGGFKNEWIGEQESNFLKAERIKEVKDFIDNIKVYGNVNFKALYKYIDKVNGIPLSGIVPRETF